MIDLSTLKNLMGDNEAMVQKFLDIFKNQTPVQLEELEHYLNSKDWKNASNVAHAIKSQCKYLGLETIADLAYQIESNTESEIDLESQKQLFEDMNQRLTIILESLK